MAGQSLQLMVNSGQLINLVTDQNIQKLFNLYEMEDMVTEARIAISETFLAISKNIGLRKIFLRPDYHSIFMKNSLQLVEG